MTVEKTDDLKNKILQLKEDKKAVILAHYYQQGDIQDIADYVGDSLALAQIAEKIDAPVIVMCGVHFMGETVKILCPDKMVLVPDMEAGCSLADSCEASAFEKFIRHHPGHTVISYVNTTAAVKALTDVVVTSGNAKEIVETFPVDHPIIFGPDKNLGNYINSITGRNMVLWNGACHVHEKFSIEKILELKKQYPQAKILVHPECKKPLQLIADKIGSTAVLLKYAKESDYDTFIVATESGILHQMQKDCKGKRFIAAPAVDSTCGCNECNYMKLNTMEKLYECLKNESPQIHVDERLIEAARRPIERMLELSKSIKK